MDKYIVECEHQSAYHILEKVHPRPETASDFHYIRRASSKDRFFARKITKALNQAESADAD